MSALSKHPDFEHYYDKIKELGKIVRANWAGPGFRSARPVFASKPYRLTGVGAVLTGARFSTLRLVPTLYFALDAQTCQAEADAKAARYGWTAADMHPQTRFVCQLNLQAVIDFTSAPVLAPLGLTPDLLTGCDWQTDQLAGKEPLTQALGRAVLEAGAEGLLVPSARLKGGVNLVYFPTNMLPGSTLATLHEEEIPFVHGL